MDDIFYRVQLYYKYRSGFKLFLVDVNTNICDYIREKSVSKIFDLIWPTLKQYITTSPGQDLRCPFIGKFSLNKWPANGGIVNNMFIPAGDYLLNNTFLTSSMEYIWNGKFFFNVPEGRTIEDDRMGR